MTSGRLGIIGGTGWLGGVLARGMLTAGVVPAGDLWLSNRSGRTGGFERWPDIHFTTDNQELVGRCDVVLLAVLPGQLAALEIDAVDRLVVSVMAGTTVARLREITGAVRLVRSMPTFTAEQGLSYTPWYATPEVTAGERARVQELLTPSGLAEEVESEELIDVFTALTGSGPGFIAYVAQAMIESAVKRGVDPARAERAVRQLFHGAGAQIAASEQSPGETVRALAEYPGTTAAGLEVLMGSSLAEDLDRALAAAYDKATGGMTGG
jgi:pyrroline-5-carboxylate reductase